MPPPSSSPRRGSRVLAWVQDEATSLVVLRVEDDIRLIPALLDGEGGQQLA
jgi:hypothetical protein